MIQLELEFDGHVFVPQQPIDLPAGYRVIVSVENGVANPLEPVSGKTALQKLADFAEALSPDGDLPADYASQVDHYLYGTPKRP
jgi:predicted DNA-binding antitoxin AbrB/MazE fold protein